MIISNAFVHASVANFYLFFIFLSLTANFLCKKLLDQRLKNEQKIWMNYYSNALWPVAKQMQRHYAFHWRRFRFVYFLGNFIYVLCLFTLHFTFSADMLWKQWNEIFENVFSVKFKCCTGKFGTRAAQENIYIKLNIEMKGIHCTEQ